MIVDNGAGLVKACWNDIRAKVKKVEPKFAKLVDELSPDKTFAVYLAYFPYGALKGDTESSFMPGANGSYYRLSDPDAPKDVVRNLGYGVASSPFGMVLDKCFEYYVDLKQHPITKPWQLSYPGTFFPLNRIFGPGGGGINVPNGVLTVSAGARSTFMLPSISRDLNHGYLQRDYQILSDTPSGLYDQWSVFKAIANSEVADCNWRACLLYFSEKWINKILNDVAWVKVKTYLFQKAWYGSEFVRTLPYFDVIFSDIHKRRNLKINPYILDTAKHIISITLGGSIGYGPQIGDLMLPIKEIQKAYIESYGMKQYSPVIVAPSIYNKQAAIYYSLNYTSALEVSPRSISAASTLSELRELERVLRVYKSELTEMNHLCSGATISKVLGQNSVAFFHNKADSHNVVSGSRELFLSDENYKQAFNSGDAESLFCHDAAFLRGCVQLKPVTN